MKYIPVIAFAFLLLLQPSFAQDKTKIKAEAAIAANAFAKGDYETFTNHIYPKMLDIMGGKKATVDMLTTQIGMMKKQGMGFEKVTIGEPGEIYKGGTDLFCLVPETIVLKMQNKYITSTSHLLAVSSNKGTTWFFIDSSASGSGDTMKKLFPNWNDKLVIPHPTQPVYSDKAP